MSKRWREDRMQSSHRRDWKAPHPGAPLASRTQPGMQKTLLRKESSTQKAPQQISFCCLASPTSSQLGCPSEFCLCFFYP